jgi:putative ABC transport system ATP-binding protein
LSEPVVARCRGLSKTYRTSAGLVEALHEVDAHFGAGRITAVVGPSGSGKSTLLKILAGLERPSGGELRVDGGEVSAWTGRRMRHYRRDTVTYVSQSPADNFLPTLRIIEHVGVGRRAEADGEVFARFGIADRVHERPRVLSGGEQARAAFALALMRRTRLIVADEPTAELDDESSAPLLTALRDSADSGVALTIATHDPAVIELADDVIRLDRGRIARSSATAPPAAAAPAPPLDAGTALVAGGLTKTYGRGRASVRAVDAVDLAVPRATLTIVSGRSGSGKSTLLNLLGGWQRCDAGDVRYHANREPQALGWHELAFVPQRFGLLTELTIRGNIDYPSRLRGTLEQDNAWIEHLLSELRLTELADRLPTETSIGQQQRTALARALALRPAVLLADEPTSHQDIIGRDAVISLLRRITCDGTTCLIATHEDAVAARGDTVWEMSAGRLARRR